ncbi:MlaD family protein [Desulfocurvus sp. DL9XJH121]
MAFKTGTEIKVGLFVLIAILALGYMSLQVGSGSMFGDDAYELVVTFDNVTGLKVGAPVEVAGIEVGKVSGIGLENGRARLVLAVNRGVRVRADVTAMIKSRGVLGDKFVELAGGSDSYPQLEAGQSIQRSDRSADLELLFQKVGQIADDIGAVAKSVASVMGGPQGERDLRLTFESLRDLSVGLNQMVQSNMESVNMLVENLREFSTDLRDVSGRNKQGINTIIENFEVASGQLRTTLDRMGSVLEKIDSGQGAMGAMINDEQMGKDLKQTMASLQSVASKIDEGRGTLGKLINDEETADNVDKALEGINRYLEKQDTFKTVLDYHGEVQSETGDIKSYLNLELHPGKSHYYLLGLVSDPKGRTEDTDTTYKTWSGGSYSERRVVEEETKRDGLKFNAQIAKRWDDLVLRGGIFESTGGVGADYYFWDDRLQAYFEAFDFDQDDPAHLKAGIKFHFLKNFYVAAGWDDFASTSGDSTFFAGAGLRFTDEDLKYIMSSAPVPGMD